LVGAWKLDARRCISYLTIELAGPVAPDLRPPLGDWVFGCDVCQEVCPWNGRAAAADEEQVGDCPDFRPTKMGLSPSPMLPAPGRNPIELASLFFLDDAAFRARFRHTPLWRPRRRGLLRSAALSLGNRPQEASLAALARGLGDPEPLVRGACAWALGRCDRPAGRESLRLQLMVEPDGEVRQEIRSALAACGSAAAGLPGSVTGNTGG
jgi:epoxyqueuosine reductase